LTVWILAATLVPELKPERVLAREDQFVDRGADSVSDDFPIADLVAEQLDKPLLVKLTKS
jgi:hypothetical protein